MIQTERDSDDGTKLSTRFTLAHTFSDAFKYY
jgi:hypothetical protein